MTRGVVLSHDAGQCQWAAAASQPLDYEGKQPVHLTTILFFTFSTVFNKLHEIFNTYYKTGFVLGDFVQL